MTCSSSSSSRDELSKWSVIDNTANPPHSDQNDIDLPARIHAASRSIHHTLHHAVVGRLPLALPPQTNSPHLYALGISRFARIYSAFENAWRDFLNTSSADLSAKDQVRYHALLSHAYVPAITRSQRLASDLANLRAEWGDDVGGTEENDAAVWDAVRHISETCVKKPYVLLAYSWIMYMALFNGGRWIRDQLLNAGPQFWLREEDADKPDSLIGSSFLSFWSFDGTEDGEDIKRAFRARFVEASHKFLTENECDDVIHEAKVLFQHCLNIVSEIDVAVALERKKRDDKSRRANYGLGVSDRHALLIIITLGVSLAMAVSYYGRLMT